MALVERAPEKVELLFRKYKLSSEDLVWVTVAKINAYLDLLLITESDSRHSNREHMKQATHNFFLKP